MVTIAWIRGRHVIKEKTSRESQDQAPDATGILGSHLWKLQRKPPLMFSNPLTTIPKMVIGFGFESEIQKAEPVFKAKEIMERCQNTQSPQINTDKSS